MSDDDRPIELERRAFIKRMIALGFAVPVVTALDPLDAAADDKDKGRKHKHKHCTTTSTTAPPGTTIEPTTTAPPGTTILETTAPPGTTILETTAPPGTTIAPFTRRSRRRNRRPGP